MDEVPTIEQAMAVWRRRNPRSPLGHIGATIHVRQITLNAIETIADQYPTEHGWRLYHEALGAVTSLRRRHPQLPATPTLPASITPSAALALLRDWCMTTDRAQPATIARKQSAPDPPPEDDPNSLYKPAEWFTHNTNIRLPRLRQATSPRRKRKKVRRIIIDSRPHYNVQDAKRWWESDWTKPPRA